MRFRLILSATALSVTLLTAARAQESSGNGTLLLRAEKAAADSSATEEAYVLPESGTVMKALDNDAVKPKEPNHDSAKSEAQDYGYMRTEALSTKQYDFKWSQTALPATLITAGAIMVPAGGKLRSISNKVTFSVSGLRAEGPRLTVDDYIQYLPVASSLFAGCAGIESRHSFRDRAIIVASSYAVMGLLTNVTKICVDEKRPEFATHNSFPSGHTATAFMGAELVRLEYGGWYGAAAYGIAAGVGFLRMYNGRHWFHDVVAGAGIGILSARAGEWSLRLWEDIFPGLKSNALVLSPLALPYREGGYYGLALACRF